MLEEKNVQEIKSLDKYINALTSTFAYSLMLDRDAKILYYSDSLKNLFGITNPETLIGTSFIEACKLFDDPNIAQRVSSRISHISSGKEEFFVDDSVTWPGGMKRMYRIIYKRVMDENNNFSNILIVSYDITDLRFSEIKLRMDELLKSTVLPCLIWDKNGDIVEYNEGAARAFDAPEGLSPEEFNKFLLLIQPKFQPDGKETETIRQEIIAEALEKGFSQINIRLAKNDGTFIYFMVNVARAPWVFDYRLIVYYHDITDLMLKEIEAKEVEERIKLMLNAYPMMCILRDDQGNIIDCNQAALNMIGVPNKSDFCANFYSFFPEFQPDGTRSVDTMKVIMEALSEKDTYSLERTFRTPAGEIIPVDTKIVRIPWKNTHYYLSFSRDLREVKANEQKVLEIAKRERKAKRQKEAAQAANEAKSQFLANMSHEIRTPMNAILGISELLLHGNLNERQLLYVGDIKKSAMALLNIINDILDVSKLQTGKLNLVPVHYDFHEFINDISSTMRFLIKDKNIDFELTMQEQAPLCLYGDDIRLRQILLNLLSNAVKFTDEGKVQLTVSFTDTTIKMTVSDTGIGIPTENIPTLFDAFEQVDVKRNRNKKGAGLGLTITKFITEIMGGQITVESTYGQGTSFHVVIPKVLGDAALIPHFDDKELTIYAPDAKALLVDDNVINLNVALGLLQIYSITSETATSGKQAIELVQQNQYDVIFMDHMMPELDGIETTKIIRKMGITIPIIAFTANAVTGVKEMMLEAGMNDYLSKPIIKTELIHVLKKWLPAEKLLDPPSERTVSLETEDEQHEELWKRIEQIEGLSMSIGLDRLVGQRDIYKKTLKLMIKEIEKACNNLNKFLLAEDMDNFYIEVHGIKGALANIGAMKLSAKAFDLEIASAKMDSAFCIKNLPPLLEGLSTFGMKLKEAFSAINSSPSDDLLIIPPALPHIFERLTDACAETDLVLIDKEMENLDALNLSDALKEEIEYIKDLVMMMNYDEAAEQMHKLLTSTQHAGLPHADK